MAPLQMDEEQKLNKYLSGQGGLDLGDIQKTNAFANGDDLKDIPVQSPHPPTPIAPVSTSTGSAEELNHSDDRIQDSDPGHADDLTGYIKGQEAQVDQYGPEQEKAVIDNIIKSRGSFGNRLGRAGAGLGDAIMGVAGKQGPGFLNSLDNREANQEKTLIDEIPNLQNLNLQNMGANQKLEGMSSSTPLGASEAAPQLAILKSMGIPDNAAKAAVQNPAAFKSILDPYSRYMGEKEKGLIDMLYKQLESSQREQQIQATIGNEKEQRSLEDRKNKSEHYIQNALGMLDDSGNKPVENTNEVVRRVKGKPAIFDSTTRQFKRWQ